MERIIQKDDNNDIVDAIKMITYCTNKNATSIRHKDQVHQAQVALSTTQSHKAIIQKYYVHYYTNWHCC